ncbi:acyl-CoA synthetase [Litorilituus sediminis]|uniref:Acyl-CoA synthetase n=1 Tax=Litorilituus sediminis TaxID=718192 RepID=A0A4P6PBK7_9GAMM|nr:acyl-CoA synthetase [Litorilituus sediminis]QBG37017.1 acyl-CoA synthetase [Litorilituus sediminis]
MTDFVYKPQLSVLTQSEQRIELLLTIPENLYYFQGHFPQAAILPGVAQLDWVMQYLAEYFSVDTSTLQSVDALKFQHIVRPNYQVTLELSQIKYNKFAFSYHSAHGQHASGKVVLA